jgi:hypothetical protein
MHPLGTVGTGAAGRTRPHPGMLEPAALPSAFPGGPGSVPLGPPFWGRAGSGAGAAAGGQSRPPGGVVAGRANTRPVVRMNRSRV